MKNKIFSPWMMAAAAAAAAFFAPDPALSAEKKAPEKSAPAPGKPAPEKKNALRTALSAMVTAFKPLYTLAGTSVQEIRDPALTPETIYAFRAVFSGNPLEKIIPAKEQTGRKTPEFADVLLIPADSPFRADKALAMGGRPAPGPGNGGGNMFIRRYGLNWRKLPGKLRTFIVYAGKNRDFHVFASSNLPFLIHLQNVLALKGGFSKAEYLAEALGVRDEHDITAEAASRMIPFCGDEALPFLAGGIARMISIDEAPYPHFRALVRIGSPAACKMLNEYAASSDRKILLPLYDALASSRRIAPELKECYLSMLSNQIAVPFAVEACKKIRAGKEASPLLQKILTAPESYTVYLQAFLADYGNRHPGAKSIHADAEEHIRIFLIRNGEVPDSIQYINIEESAADQERRLAGEDRKRIEPFFESLRKAPEKDLTVLVGMNLAMTEIPVRGVSQKYVHRLRATGIRLLKSDADLHARAQTLLRKLLTHCRSEKEQSLLRETANQLN